ncbi:MAG: hypothetical protein VX519_08135, partial [Myxococcota bacterium]|nr:hypothetical protein [Myxococcota bacterium]
PYPENPMLNTRPSTSLILALTAFTMGCRTEDGSNSDLEARIAALEDALSAQEIETSSQAEALDALTTHANDNTTGLDNLAEEVDALSGGVDLTDIQDQVDTNTAQLAALDPEDLATEDWVTSQGFVTDNDITNLENTVATNTSSIATNSSAISSTTVLVAGNTGSIAQNSIAIAANSNSVAANSNAITTNTTSLTSLTSTLATNTSAIATNTADIASNSATTATHTTDIAANATAIATNTASGATNASGVATNAAAIAANATNATTNAADIATNSGDIATNATSASANAADIATNATDITNNATDISDLGDASSLFGTPALWETSLTTEEHLYNQGRSGLLLITSDGAFYQSFQVNTDVQSGTRAYITFYVNNPTTSDISVDWNFCRSDNSTVTVDGTNVASPSDGDGHCSAVVNFTLTPGSHVVQITDYDSNNLIEGVGVRNAWIAANGLEVDYTALETATASAL